MTDVTLTPTDVIAAFFTAFERLDYDTALSHVSADSTYENMPFAYVETPLTRVRGPAGIRAVLEPFFAPAIENEFRILNAVASGPLVIIERLDRHHLADGWVELPVAGVFEVHHGKITLWRDYFDAATILGKWPQAPA